MKATSFLNADEVVIKTSDGSWFKLNEQESRKWINNFLYWVAGQGENTTNVKDGKIEDGNFVTSINTYHDIIPHKPVYL